MIYFMIRLSNMQIDDINPAWFITLQIDRN